jgi:hypothetical protein
MSAHWPFVCWVSGTGCDADRVTPRVEGCADGARELFHVSLISAGFVTSLTVLCLTYHLRLVQISSFSETSFSFASSLRPLVVRRDDLDPEGGFARAFEGGFADVDRVGLLTRKGQDVPDLPLFTMFIPERC